MGKVYETIGLGATVFRRASSGMYSGGKIYPAPNGEATREAANLLTGIVFKAPGDVALFLDELKRRAGFAEDDIHLTISKRITARRRGTYDPLNYVGGKHRPRIFLYSWTVETLVHEFAHHVDRSLSDTSHFAHNGRWKGHDVSFYECLAELFGIAFEILGTTLEEERGKLSTLKVDAAVRGMRRMEWERKRARARVEGTPLPLRPIEA